MTKFPNHWWASSCPTTSATHCLEDEQEFFGSISSAVSLENSRKWGVRHTGGWRSTLPVSTSRVSPHQPPGGHDSCWLTKTCVQVAVTCRPTEPAAVCWSHPTNNSNQRVISAVDQHNTTAAGNLLIYRSFSNSLFCPRQKDASITLKDIKISKISYVSQGIWHSSNMYNFSKSLWINFLSVV